MPAFSTHYYFASDMIQYLKENLPFKVNEDAVYIGTQGPDIFFFHRALPFWKGQTLRKTGSLLHRAKAGELIDRMNRYAKTSENPDIAKSYIAGFILHYALDRNEHPYIYCRQNRLTDLGIIKNANSAHNEVELAIDSVMLKVRKNSKKPLKEKTDDMIAFTEDEILEVGRTAAAMADPANGIKFAPADVVTAVRDTKKIQKLLHDSTGLKKIFVKILERIASPFTNSFLVSKMFRTNDLGRAHTYINYEHGEWESPFDKEKKIRTESFFDLYEEARIDAEEMLKKWTGGLSGEDITDNRSFLTGEKLKPDTITSFEIDHRKLKRGIYISRIDGDVITYDIRMKVPNADDYLDNAALHTIEHLFATYVRNSEYKENIIYFGPMGCRTGFYFLTRSLTDSDAIELTKRAFKYISEHEGAIPGADIESCGNYKEHSLEGAKKEAEEFLRVIENWSADDLQYPQ